MFKSCRIYTCVTFLNLSLKKSNPFITLVTEAQHHNSGKILVATTRSVLRQRCRPLPDFVRQFTKLYTRLRMTLRLRKLPQSMPSGGGYMSLNVLRMSWNGKRRM